ncbi:immunity 8 family protein [Tahibacter amnicola]|uniref:Immunity 8 family protein n=1 Tax=Tahibacter amnicola TaxID=2976241 RepID=A0ABY6BA50_9GAMM|nr:immunity 8 family protein [Tahibacter amnicola]UXI66936.1 immunity 8 family protein [Tahibacter amnicola]
MRAILKEIYSIETEVPLQDYWPGDPSNFALSVRLLVGPEGEEAAESFDVLVCTPDWIKHQYSAERAVWGRHMLIVLEFDFALIERKR